MGKKRRLKSAKAKFSAKHANHPRAKFLAQMAAKTAEPEVVEVAPPELNLKVEETTPEPKLIQKTAETPTLTIPTVPKPKLKTAKTKKTTTSTRKRSTSTKKRAPKKKTTAASA
jgi:hypothetical protein|tara:strand:- start:75 stop:416 length:342 start_codon:yes stop_codon:yes gene_type:complete